MTQEEYTQRVSDIYREAKILCQRLVEGMDTNEYQRMVASYEDGKITALRKVAPYVDNQDGMAHILGILIVARDRLRGIARL